MEVNEQVREDVHKFVCQGTTVCKEGGGIQDIHDSVVQARGV